MSTLITNEQMRLCNRLFDMGFRFKTFFNNGSIVLSKKTIGGMVILTLCDRGYINEKASEEFFNYYSANQNHMIAPSPITIKPSMF